MMSSMQSEFIQNYHWNMPADLWQNLPVLRQLVVQVIIPSKQKRDQLIWNATTSYNLSFKDAFLFKSQELLGLQLFGLN